MEINKEIIKILDKIITNKHNYITWSYHFKGNSKKLKTYNPFLYNGIESKYHYKVIQNIKLFIDSTFINNKYAVEYIGLNIDNKKKKASKLSIICNENKFIFSIISIKLNKNNKNKYNGFTPLKI